MQELRYWQVTRGTLHEYYWSFAAVTGANLGVYVPRGKLCFAIANELSVSLGLSVLHETGQIFLYRRHWCQRLRLGQPQVVRADPFNKFRRLQSL